MRICGLKRGLAKLINEWWNEFHVVGWAGYTFTGKLKFVKSKLIERKKKELGDMAGKNILELEEEMFVHQMTSAA